MIDISRRAMMGWTAALAGKGAARAIPADLPITPAEEIGPFYPLVAAYKSQVDMTRVPGRDGRAAGSPIDLIVMVRDAKGKPVPGAMVLTWQASAAGVYGHPRDLVKQPADQDFRGHALLREDREGAVRIATIMPGAYPDEPGRLRTPHMHFEIIGEEGRLITQMYFPGEALNAKDRLIAEMVAAGRDPRALTCQRLEPASSRYQWNVVLERR